MKIDQGKAELLPQLFPTKEQWAAALQPFLNIPPKHSSSLIDSLSGAAYLVATPSPQPPARNSVDRDYNQCSLAYRLAYFVTNMLTRIPQSDHFANEELKHALFLYLPLVIQLINDDLNVEDSTGVVALDVPDIRDDCANLVSEARLIMKRWIEEDSGFVNYWEDRLRDLNDDTPQAYRMAETLAKVVSEKDSLGKLNSAESSFQLAEQMSGPSNPFIMPAVIAAYRNSLVGAAASTRLCNRLIADLTDLNSLSASEGSFRLTSSLLLL